MGYPIVVLSHRSRPTRTAFLMIYQSSVVVALSFTHKMMAHDWRYEESQSEEWDSFRPGPDLRQSGSQLHNNLFFSISKTLLY